MVLGAKIQHGRRPAAVGCAAYSHHLRDNAAFRSLSHTHVRTCMSTPTFTNLHYFGKETEVVDRKEVAG